MADNIEKSYFPGIDLLKLISIFFVLILHTLGQGGVLNATQAPHVNYWVAWLLEIFAYCAVNCFALATGYLMVGKKLKYRKIVPMWLTVFFYTLLLMIIGNAYWPDFVKGWDWAYVTPVTSAAYWYFTAYVFLFFCIPFLNKMIDNLTRRDHMILLLTGFLLIVGANAIGIVNADPFRTSSGYSAVWLIYLYLFGAGVKKHGFFTRIPAWVALVGYVGSVLVTWASQYVMYALLQNLPEGTVFYNVLNRYGFKHLISYTSPTIVCSGVFLMIFCLNVRLPKLLHKPLRWTAPHVFQVYIIHQHYVLWNKIIKNRFVDYAQMSTGNMVLSVLGTVGILFLQCLCIDIVRYWLFKLLHIDKLVNVVAEKINGCYRRRCEKKAAKHS